MNILEIHHIAELKYLLTIFFIVMRHILYCHPFYIFFSYFWFFLIDMIAHDL